MTATKQDITIEQGATYSDTLAVGTAYNTYTARGKIRDAFGGNVLADFTGGTVTAGSVSISLTAAQTAALTATDVQSDQDREVPLGFYDIELVSGDLVTVVRVRQGKVILSREVTA